MAAAWLVGSDTSPTGRGPGVQRWSTPSPRVIDLADPALEGGGPRGSVVRVLLVEDDPLFADLVRSALAESGSGFEIDCVSRVTAALAWLVREHADLILADLNLPDSKGAGTVRLLKRAAPNVPLIALSGNDNLGTALDAVREGAEEYVAKGAFSVRSLVWLVLLVMERHRRVSEKGYLDPLSGLTSLPAMEVLGRYLLKVADRTGLNLAILFVRTEVASRGRWSDWEALLVEASSVLHQTLRRCDVLSRIARSELAVILVSENPNVVGALPRIRAAMEAAGIAHHVQVGFAVHRPTEPETLDEILDRARAGAHPVSA
ncbi:MAG TPA: response regulator [Acidimicrobiia bacterium]|jgi:CheY-like chemotaxis protein